MLPPSLNEVFNYTTPAAAILLAAGSLLHCSLMCGPIAAATMSTAKSTSTRKWHFLQYQLGRSFSYSLAGLAAASVGHVLRPSPIAVGFFLAVILLLVIAQLFQITVPQFSRLAFSRSLRPLQRLKPIGKFQSLGLGLLTPLIPCGQLWMVLGFSALAMSPIEGAALAFGFSVFSAPGVYGFSFLKEQLLKLSVRQPHLIKACLRSAIVFVLALSAVKYSSLLTQTSQAETKRSSPTNLICH